MAHTCTSDVILTKLYMVKIVTQNHTLYLHKTHTRENHFCALELFLIMNTYAHKFSHKFKIKLLLCLISIVIFCYYFYNFIFSISIFCQGELPMCWAVLGRILYEQYFCFHHWKYYWYVVYPYHITLCLVVI